MKVTAFSLKSFSGSVFRSIASFSTYLDLLGCFRGYYQIPFRFFLPNIATEDYLGVTYAHHYAF